MILARAAAAITGLRPGPRYGLAALAGASTALGFAPFNLWPVLFLACPVLVLTLDGAARSARPALAAFLTGWAFGFGAVLAGTFWVAYAFVVDAATYGWMVPFVLVLFPAGLGLFQALAALAARPLWTPGPGRVAALAAMLTLGEWLRGRVLTGFPWNPTGGVWAGGDGVIQSVSLIGVEGLSALTLAASCSLVLLADAGARERMAALRLIAVPFTLAGILAVASGWGLTRVMLAPQERVAGVHLRIVQPNTPQHEKYRPDYLERNWSQLISLTRRPAEQTVTHVIWPEAAPPFLLERTPGALTAIAAALEPGQILLTGAVRMEKAADGTRRHFNGIAAVDDQGLVIARYDKHHLVPFGEYLPLEPVLEALGLEKLTGGRGGFTPGRGPGVLSLPGLPPFAPLICYEIIFPGRVAGLEPRPQFLLNPTDDSWFGSVSTGPFQHLQIARTRAIEEGIPVVRAANTGVSAVFDAYGRSHGQVAHETAGVLDVDLPAAADPTGFTRGGNLSVLVFILLLLAAGIALRAVRKPGD